MEVQLRNTCVIPHYSPPRQMGRLLINWQLVVPMVDDDKHWACLWRQWENLKVVNENVYKKEVKIKSIKKFDNNSRKKLITTDNVLVTVHKCKSEVNEHYQRA